MQKHSLTLMLRHKSIKSWGPRCNVISMFNMSFQIMIILVVLNQKEDIWSYKMNTFYLPIKPAIFTLIKMHVFVNGREGIFSYCHHYVFSWCYICIWYFPSELVFYEGEKEKCRTISIYYLECLKWLKKFLLWILNFLKLQYVLNYPEWKVFFYYMNA